MAAVARVVPGLKYPLVWFGYAAGTTVTHGAPTGDSHPHSITKDNTVLHIPYNTNIR